jgi:hypothetical protein
MACLLRPALAPLTEDVSHLHDQGTGRALRPSHPVLVERRRLCVIGVEYVEGAPDVVPSFP